MKLIILGLIILVISVIIYFSNKGIREGIAAADGKSYIKITGNTDGIEDNALKINCGGTEITFDRSENGNVMSDLSSSSETVLRLPDGIEPSTCETTFKKRKLDSGNNEICDLHSVGESNTYYCNGWTGTDSTGKFERLGTFDVSSEAECITACQTAHTDKNNHACQKGDYLPEINELDTTCSSDETSNLVYAGLTIMQWRNLTSKGVQDYIKWVNKGGGEQVDNMNSTASSLPNVSSQTVLRKSEVEKYVEEIRSNSVIQFGEPSLRNDNSLIKHPCWDYNYFNRAFNTSKRQSINEWPPPSMSDPAWHKEMCDAEVAANNYQVFATGYGKMDSEKWGEFNSCCQFTYLGDKIRGPYSGSESQSQESKNLYNKCQEANSCVKDAQGRGVQLSQAVQECETNAPSGGFGKAAYSVGIKLAEGPDLGKERKQGICERKVTYYRTNHPERLGRDQDTTSWELGEFSSWGDMRKCCQFGIQGEKGYGPYKNGSITEEDSEKLVDACIMGQNGLPIEILPSDSTNEEKGAWRVGKRLSLILGNVKQNKINEWQTMLSNIKDQLPSVQENSVDSLKEVMEIPQPNISEVEKNYILDDDWTNDFLSKFDKRKGEYTKKNMYCSDWSGKRIQNNGTILFYDGCDLTNKNGNKICDNSVYGTNTGNGKYSGDGGYLGLFRVKGSNSLEYKNNCKFRCGVQVQRTNGTVDLDRIQCSENSYLGATDEYDRDQEEEADRAAANANRVNVSNADAAAASMLTGLIADANSKTCPSNTLDKTSDYQEYTTGGKIFCILKEDANKKERPYCYHRISASILDDSRLTKKWGSETECQAIQHRGGGGACISCDNA